MHENLLYFFTAPSCSFTHEMLEFSKHDAPLSKTKSLAGRKWDNAANSLCSYTDLCQLQISPVILPRHRVELL